MSRLKLNDKEWLLVIDQVSNELINGFKLNDFKRKIGLPEHQYKSMMQDFRLRAVTTFDSETLPVLRNALAEVLLELGLGEFQTRTGYDYVHGQTLLRRLEQFAPQTQEADQ